MFTGIITGVGQIREVKSLGESGQVGININQNYQRAKGYLDYINYFNEKLK